MSHSILFEAALRYAELGYTVFPCVSGTKIPLTEHGFKDATTDPDQIEAWWSTHPTANIGIATEGLVVIDVEGGSNWLLDDFEKQFDLSVAPMSITPSGGRHYIFRQPPGKDYRNTEKQIGHLVDTRANGGLIIAPPAAIGKNAYRWVEGNELDIPPSQLPEPPDWLIDLLDGTTSGSSPRVATATEPESPIPEGQRNGTLARLAGTMRRAGMSQPEIAAAIRQVNNDRCRPPLSHDEVQQISESIVRYEPDDITVALIENHWEQLQSAPEERFTAITSNELSKSEFTLEYLIEGVLVRGQPAVIAGPKKTLKTTIAIDLALSLGHAGLFLGRYNVPEAVRVGVMSGESGAATIQETARRISWAKHWSLEYFENVVWSFDVPQLNVAKDIASLKQFILNYELEVLILDPTYLMMLSLGQDASNLFVVGSYLKAIGELAQETGCTPILCHHLKKSVAEPYEPAELENIAWAGFQEFVRQWILLNRRVKYDPDNGGHHELWMSVGGSAGHSGLWGLNVNEGTRDLESGRFWEVEVISAKSAYAQRSQAEEESNEERKKQQQETRDEKQRTAILDALKLFPDGETVRVIRELAGVSGAVASRHLAELVAEGIVEECELQKNHRRERGFKLCE